jgi:hypothetical protein
VQMWQLVVIVVTLAVGFVLVQYGVPRWHK